jgi:hypothetical protein
MGEFTSILSVTWEQPLYADPATGRNPAFEIVMKADGDIPFPQIIVRQGSFEHLLRDRDVRRTGPFEYAATIQAGSLPAGTFDVQAEGCRTPHIAAARPEDWIKHFCRMTIQPPRETPARAEVGTAAAPAGGVRIYFGIHKHMHQPYYDAVDPRAWDGEKDGIFEQRSGAYSVYLPDAVRQYVEAGLPHAGLSTSWSGSLIEQLHRCERQGLCGGRFARWADALRDMAAARTELGNPRLDFTSFGFFHPLMPMIPGRDTVRQIAWHRRIVHVTFGADASPVLFPPETAFHVRMIPALVEAGVEAVVYDSIHRYRTCADYPYAGLQEGMLPPNRADQVNPAAGDWTALHNVWAASKISPGLLKPEWVEYEDPEGIRHRIVAVPAERYLGNEDARGGFGALQYPDCFGQLHASISAHGSYDPAHPPFLILHSDGDNYGGGADSYYRHNTAMLVQWLRGDPRFELTTVRDYLQRFPPDPRRAVHIEPGAWSGADNGDPQFRKWFSMRLEAYSPDLNSWAVLTALQNAVHSVQDARPGADSLPAAERLLLTAETSCYWYWTGQQVWDSQVTRAANHALDALAGELLGLKDRTGPTIFPPWVVPENPGGLTWGAGRLHEAERQGVVHGLVSDISGLRRVVLVIRSDHGEESRAMQGHGPYPSRTGARASAEHYTCPLPVGLGNARFFIEAEDGRGNVSRGSLERIFLP